MDIIASIAERKIQEAMARGEFDNLPGRGKPLVLEFIRDNCPAELARVEGFFNRPGAFRNVKDLLRRRHLLDNWQIFEMQQMEALLKQWCLAQGLTS